MLSRLSFLMFCFFVVVGLVGLVEADEDSQNQISVSVGYAIWGGVDIENSVTLETSFRHYFRKHLAIEALVTYFTERTTEQLDPVSGIRYEFSRWMLPVHVNFVYSPLRRTSGRGVSLFFGAGMRYTRNSLTGPGGFTSSADESTLDVVGGLLAHFPLRDNYAVLSRLMLGYAGTEYALLNIGFAWSF